MIELIFLTGSRRTGTSRRRTTSWRRSPRRRWRRLRWAPTSTTKSNLWSGRETAAASSTAEAAESTGILTFDLFWNSKSHIFLLESSQAVGQLLPWDLINHDKQIGGKTMISSILHVLCPISNGCERSIQAVDHIRLNLNQKQVLLSSTSVVITFKHKQSSIPQAVAVL